MTVTPTTPCPYQQWRRIWSWEDSIPLWNSDQPLVPDLMERLFSWRRLLDPRTEFETCQVCPCCLQKASPHCLLLLTSHPITVTIAMSIYASSISTKSSLPIVSLLSSGHSPPMYHYQIKHWLGITQWLLYICLLLLLIKWNLHWLHQ